jgi:hypothetical protein
MSCSAPAADWAQALCSSVWAHILSVHHHHQIWADGKLSCDRPQSYVEAIGVCLEQESVEDDASPAHLRLTKLVHEIVRARLPALVALTMPARSREWQTLRMSSRVCLSRSVVPRVMME